MSTWRRCAAVVVLALVVAGCGSTASEGGSGFNQGAATDLADAADADTISVTGTLHVPGRSESETSIGSCSGTLPGYDDIGPGAQVVVTDASGTTVGTGMLGGGIYQDGLCIFDFSVPGVTGEAEFYGIEVSHRGVVTFSRSEVATPVELSLG